MAFLLGIIISAGIFSVVFLISKDNLQKKDREGIGERENADYKVNCDMQITKIC